MNVHGKRHTKNRTKLLKRAVISIYTAHKHIKITSVAFEMKRTTTTTTTTTVFLLGTRVTRFVEQTTNQVKRTLWIPLKQKRNQDWHIERPLKSHSVHWTWKYLRLEKWNCHRFIGTGTHLMHRIIASWCYSYWCFSGKLQQSNS